MQNKLNQGAKTLTLIHHACYNAPLFTVDEFKPSIYSTQSTLLYNKYTL